MLNPLWYIPYETLVIILQVIKNLEDDLKRKIVQIIAQYEKENEENLDAINYNFNDVFEMNTSDYYWTE